MKGLVKTSEHFVCKCSEQAFKELSKRKREFPNQIHRMQLCDQHYVVKSHKIIDYLKEIGCYQNSNF